jgi:hypothetical protein
MGKAEPVRFGGERQRLSKIITCRFLLGFDVGEELHAELHSST